MNDDFLRHYNDELRYIKELAAEFAQDHEDIAGNLGMSGFEVADPYVERLLEGFAFLTARIKSKMDARVPEFVERLLDFVYPHMNSPIPSMAIFRFLPDLSQSDLGSGVAVPKGTTVQSVLGRGQRTPVTFRTSHEVVLWPLRLAQLRYIPNAGSVGDQIDVASCIRELRLERSDIQGAIRVRFELMGGHKLRTTRLTDLDLHVTGDDSTADLLLRQILGESLGVVMKEVGGSSSRERIIDKRRMRHLGFASDEALLPSTSRSFSGYRLLLEWFTLPSRLAFFRIGGLDVLARDSEAEVFDLFVLLRRSEKSLDQVLDISNLALFATPAINLFHRSFARTQLDDRRLEYPIIVERTRPKDYEVHSVDRVVGYGDAGRDGREFFPVLSTRASGSAYVVSRERSIVGTVAKSQRQSSQSYLGSEVFLMLREAMADDLDESGITQADVSGLCTNRDLPLFLTGKTQFSVESAAPIQEVTCLAGPTRPKPSPIGAEQTWRAINQFALNFLALGGGVDGEAGLEPLKSMLRLYCSGPDDPRNAQVDGLKAVSSAAVIRRVEGQLPIAFARGLEVRVVCNERAFEGVGLFSFGALLHAFFSRAVSVNSFVELVVLGESSQIEYGRWRAAPGARRTL